MIKNLQWLTKNSMRSFPVRENAVSRAINSGWKLDNRLIVDLSVAGSSSFSDVCVQSVTVTASILSVVIGDAVSGQSIASAFAIIGTDRAWARKPLHPILPGNGGFIAFGPLIEPDLFPSIPAGFHNFSLSAPVETRCCLFPGPLPVTGMGPSNRSDIKRGDVEIVPGANLQLSVSDDNDEEGQIHHVVFSLSDPNFFLSPCEEAATPCGCPGLPIRKINTVSANDDGIIFIEIVDENGQVTKLDNNTLSLIISRSGEALCSRPEVPDAYGRLRGPSGGYDTDKPPTAQYKNPDDTSFPDPIV